MLILVTYIYTQDMQVIQLTDLSNESRYMFSIVKSIKI